VVRRNAGRLCLFGLVAGVVATYALTLLTPSMLKHHDLLLEALSGNVASVITGGAAASVGRQSIVLVELAPLVGIVLYDVFLWWAGRLWGNRIVYAYARTPRSRRAVERAEGWVARHGVWTLVVAYFLPVPNAAVYAFCGASGMSLGTFVLGDALGTLLWTGLLAALGWSVGKPALDVVNAINHYSLVVTAALVVAFVVYGVGKRTLSGSSRRPRSGAGPAA
jgi:membrane protein DedA with SNARE-associated domain